MWAESNRRLQEKYVSLLVASLAILCQVVTKLVSVITIILMTIQNLCIGKTEFGLMLLPHTGLSSKEIQDCSLSPLYSPLEDHSFGHNIVSNCEPQHLSSTVGQWAGAYALCQKECLGICSQWARPNHCTIVQCHYTHQT